MMNRLANYYRAITHFYGALVLLAFHTCLVIAAFIEQSPVSLVCGRKALPKHSSKFLRLTGMNA